MTVILNYYISYIFALKLPTLLLVVNKCEQIGFSNLLMTLSHKQATGQID